jgi:hypothetical protein
VHLLADLGADLDQDVNDMSADALRLRQLVAHDVARERWIQRLASALLAMVTRDVRGFLVVGFGRSVCAVGASASASLRNRSFCSLPRASLLAAINCPCKARSRSSAPSPSVVTTRSSPIRDSRRRVASASPCCRAANSSAVGLDHRRAFRNGCV